MSSDIRQRRLKPDVPWDPAAVNDRLAADKGEPTRDTIAGWIASGYVGHAATTRDSRASWADRADIEPKPAKLRQHGAAPDRVA
ncbi:MAG TPA: hypothetical protein VG826_15745 [Pirellulales bacterium]|nr:hypothetical protein [Pirellulales bacterium]